MKLSAIIPTRNRANILERNLRKMVELGVSQIVVVDDASTDTTPSVSEKFQGCHTDVVYTRTERQVGSARARNIGLSKADGDIVLMMDDDRILRDRACIDAALEDFKEDPRIGIIGGPSRFPRRHGWDPEFYTKNAELLTKITGFVFLNILYDSNTLVSFVSCPFAIRREVAESIRYDEEMQGAGHTGYREESDYQLTAREKGWKILFDPRFASYHYSQDRGGNRGEVMSVRMHWKARNHALFIRKHNTGVKCMFYLLTGLGLLVIYQPRHVRETSRAYISNGRIGQSGRRERV
jgi:glycosyltransferase involved in cell wall biosynthesis